MHLQEDLLFCKTRISFRLNYLCPWHERTVFLCKIIYIVFHILIFPTFQGNEWKAVLLRHLTSFRYHYKIGATSDRFWIFWLSFSYNDLDHSHNKILSPKLYQTTFSNKTPTLWQPPILPSLQVCYLQKSNFDIFSR